MHSKSEKYLNAGTTSREDNELGNSNISNQYESKQSSSNNYVSESNVQYQIGTEEAEQNESETPYIREEISNQEENIELLPEANVYKILSDNVAKVKQELEYLKENKLPYDDPEVLVLLYFEIFIFNERQLKSFSN